MTARIDLSVTKARAEHDAKTNPGTQAAYYMYPHEMLALLASVARMREALEKSNKDVRPPNDVWGPQCRYCGYEWDTHRPGCAVASALREHDARFFNGGE